MHIIDQASKVAQKLYSQKRKSDNRPIDNYKILLSVVSFISMICFFILIYYGILHNNKSYENTGFILMAISFVIMLVLTSYETFRNSENQLFNYLERLSDALVDYTRFLNNVYQPRGMLFTFNKETKFLEVKVTI